MPLAEILFIAVGLGLDAFAVAIATGTILPRVTLRHYFRLSFHFGLFQALMPVIGWLAGETVSAYTRAWDHWLAFGLLAFVGGRMLVSRPEDDERRNADPTRGATLVVLSVATSLDALAVGFSLALLGVRILFPAVAIGIVACAMTITGMVMGQRFGSRLGRSAEKLGGFVLIGIGIKIVIDHLFLT